ncbi:unnamed protein product [Rotaria socialis]|uniref:Uncharacterized protein n=1 Tax=Rotaria socialis TaxID=392032 RepID=A0A818YIZ4_9BILA|nr:unnamed protein product [Rotaria socialis]CAF3751563.1 unnamed protein product [Rotaria socialis]CAF4254526.1 unnamed protein product [Rotaria socialis]CAF4437973.1 unnamed protein product [Rotaria socialis]CAF4670174.1 unnamed protein product [Rotaria socialis]
MIPKDWAYNCKDESLGLLHDPQTSKLDVNQSASVQIWLTSPLHRVHENDTELVTTRIKTGGIEPIIPVLRGGGYEAVLAEVYPIYIE